MPRLDRYGKVQSLVSDVIPHVLLVIPCFNESVRLPPFLEVLCPAIQEAACRVTIQVADDGSRDAERGKMRALVNRLRESHGRVLAEMLELPHAGKGGTILGAWKVAPPEVTHYGFVDADGAVDEQEIQRVLDLVFDLQVRDEDVPETCYFAIRKPTETTLIQRDPVRRLVGRVYYSLVNFILGTNIYDPACGFKVFSKPFYECCGHLLTEQEWALDIELLARLYHHGFPLRQIPVSLEEKGGSKIVRADTVRILKQIIAVKHRWQDWKKNERS